MTSSCESIHYYLDIDMHKDDGRSGHPSDKIEYNAGDF